MLALLASFALAASDCAPISARTWRAEIDAALAAYGRLDEAAFLDTAGRVDASALCLSEPIRPDDAAAWHLLSAVHAWYTDPEHPTSAVDHLRAALLVGLDPTAWPDVLIPDSPLAGIFGQAMASPVVPSPLADRSPLVLTIDGQPSGPAAPLPALIQLQDRGTLLWTMQVTPPWPRLPPPPHRGLRIAAGTLAGVAVGLWGAGVGTRLAWDEGSPTSLITANHAMLASAGGVGAISVGLGIAAILDARQARRSP